MALIERWRRRRNCFHHEPSTGKSWISAALVDLGRWKRYRCNHCGKTWLV